MLIMGISINKRTLAASQIDYSYYLGPNYKNETSQVSSPGYTSKIVSPHVSCYDVQAMIIAFGGNVSFASGVDVRKLPGIGYIAEKLGSIFIPRSSGKATLSGVLDAMNQRIELI